MVQVGLATQFITGRGRIAGAEPAKKGCPRSGFESRDGIEKESMLSTIILHRGVSGTVPLRNNIHLSERKSGVK
jgi:hypothetical protein